MTPATWPEGTEPSSAQLREWVRAATDDEVEAMFDRFAQTQADARRCSTENHAEMVKEVQILRDRWATAWRTGYDAGIMDTLTAKGDIR